MEISTRHEFNLRGEIQYESLITREDGHVIFVGRFDEEGEALRMAHLRREELREAEEAFDINNLQGAVLTTTNTDDITFIDAAHTHDNFIGGHGMWSPLNNGEPTQLDRVEKKMDLILEMLNTGLTKGDIEILGDLQLDKEEEEDGK
jgi:hypothetical protein